MPQEQHVGQIPLTISIADDQVLEGGCEVVYVWLKHWGQLWNHMPYHTMTPFLLVVSQTQT